MSVGTINVDTNGWRFLAMINRPNYIRAFVWLAIFVLLLGVVTPSEGMILCLKKDGRAGLELSFNGNQCEPCSPPMRDKEDCSDFCTDIPISVPAANQQYIHQQDTPGQGAILSDNLHLSVLGAKSTSSDCSAPQCTCLSPPLASLRSTILLI